MEFEPIADALISLERLAEGWRARVLLPVQVFVERVAAEGIVIPKLALRKRARTWGTDLELLLGALLAQAALVRIFSLIRRTEAFRIGAHAAGDVGSDGRCRF